MRTFIVILFCFLTPDSMAAQSDFSFSSFIQQPGIYYSSNRVTAYGYGLGAGCSVDWKKSFTARADVNILWGNGNLMATRMAIGYQPKGGWSPGIFITTTMLTGHKTEILDEAGQRPPAAVWATGLRILPLYFDGDKGYASALELGYGFGADQGWCMELTLLSVGLKF